MIVCTTASELTAALQTLPQARTLVPTMGGLHDGHLSLMALARQRAGTIVATIFVNRLQFDESQDFDAYPRELQSDLELLREAGADVVYVPDEMAVWGDAEPDLEDFAVPGLTDVLEGQYRPGHLCAVAAVVQRLFEQTLPTTAVFGEKDYQQLVLVRRLANMQPTPVQIVAGPVVREPDGLALSSRNRRLAPENRLQAVGLYQALQEAVASVQEGASVAQVQAQAYAMLEQSGLAPDYVAFRHPDTWAPSQDTDTEFAAVAAARLGSVRLLDYLPAQR